MIEDTDCVPEYDIEADDVSNRKLWSSLLQRALDDLNIALGTETKAPGFSMDHVISDDERAELRTEIIDWFTTHEESECSLNVVCEALGYDPSIIRRRVREIIAGANRIQLRRKHLSPEVRAMVLDTSRTSTSWGKELKINSATVRKIRIKHARKQKLAAAS